MRAAWRDSECEKKRLLSCYLWWRVESDRILVEDEGHKELLHRQRRRCNTPPKELLLHAGVPQHLNLSKRCSIAREFHHLRVRVVISSESRTCKAKSLLSSLT